MNWSSEICIFGIGLLLGLILSPAFRQACKLSRLQGVFGARGELVAPDFPPSSAESQPRIATPEEGFVVTKPHLQPVDPREQRINDSAQAVRSILLILTAVIERTDQAASESSQALKNLRESCDRAGLPAEVAAATSRLTEQIDRMISSNVSLKGKLSSAQKILTSQQRQIEMLRTAVLVDGMTQLANRSYFDDKLAEMIKLRQRYDEVFFLIILDVDHFKSINDSYGHQAGDLILKGVAARIRSTLRESDFVARFGGDEFAVILIKSTPQAAETVARKLCANVRESTFQFEGVEIKVTVSMGAAEATAFDTTESLLERADAALYRVKEMGRDNVYFEENPTL